MKIFFISFLLHPNLIKSQLIRKIVVVFFSLFLPSLAYASYMPFNTSVAGNIGVGTSTPQAKFVVISGNVGIGTWTAAGGNLIIKGGGNVGIGSVWPGATLDVQGTVRTIGITMSGQTPVSGYVLTATDSAGDTTWSSASAVSGWTVSGNNVYETNSGNVGIGTSALQTALAITNGNVGIGTWTAAGGSLIVATGNVGIGSTTPGEKLDIQGITRNLGEIVNGNVGIGSSTPGQALDVNGTVRTLAFTMSGQTPQSGFVLTATDSAGDTTWESASAVGGWTVSGNNVYETGSGNVGIGTSTVSQGSLVVTNGNVGIGTWTTAGGSLIIMKGNVGIGSAWPGVSLDVQGTVRALYFIGNGSQLTNLPAGGAAGSNTQVQYNNSGSIAGANNFVFTGSNVGIGTVTPVAQLAVAGNGVGIGTNLNDAYLTTTPPLGGMIVEGNVGIGSLTPGQKLDVAGTVRTMGFTMSGQTPVSGFVLTASDSAGDTTWASASAVSGWTVSGNNVYETGSGNVGIGTSTVNQGSLVVTNGNVGIGTWAPASLLQINQPSGSPFAVSSSGKVGIGTITPQTALAVTSGNVGIGTWTAAGGSLIVAVGNVGIGSLTPGQALDVNGTVRTTAFTMSGQTPVSGFVLTASDSAGDTTWTSAGAVSGWTVSGNNVYETASGNVGIGTTALNQGSLVVTNGNVGIGTWAPATLLQINQPTGSPFAVSSSGKVGIGTIAPQTALAVTSGNVGIGTWTAAGGSLIVAVGNVGIGSLTPGQALDVNGTVRTTAFTMSGQTPVSGFVLTASDSAGDTTWSSASAVSGWTVAGNNVFETNSGNVGIGTSTVNQGSLVVTNGNVGIGTWAPATLLQVNQPSGNPFVVSSSGKVGIGTITPQTALAVTSGNVGIGTWTAAGGSLIVAVGNVGIGSLIPGQALDVNGTVRTTAFTMSGQTPQSGYVLTASDSAGDTTWESASAVGGWTVSGNSVYETSGGNVGIGTTTVNQGTALAVTNGNVGIGTWTTAGGSLIVMKGNVGIGSVYPGVSLDVQGTVRALYFIGNGSQLTNLPAGGAAGTNNQVQYNSAGNLAGANNFVFTGSNVGIGTSTPVAQLAVAGNGVGIGTNLNDAYLTTTPPLGGMIVEGNVGIGSLTPGQKLDINGTVRTTAFTMSGQTPVSGYVLTASDSAGDATWASASAVSGWTISGNNVYETAGGNVGIGTTLLTTSALTVMNGNVGIGTWLPAALLDIKNGPFNMASPGTSAYITIGNGGQNDVLLGKVGNSSTSGLLLRNIDLIGWTSGQAPASATYDTSMSRISAGVMAIGIGTQGTYAGTLIVNNIGIGTSTPVAQLAVAGNGVGIGTNLNDNYLTTAPPLGGMIVESNVGIGSLTPGQKLDVNGTVRTTAFTMSGQTPVSGFVLTASDSAGDTTWTSAGAVSGWTISGNNVYETAGGNVGVGTTLLTTSALTVMNGNVGIGTWVPDASLAVNGYIAAEGSYPITSSPPSVLTKNGWKIGLYGNQYAIGTANYTMAFLIGGSQWFSIFGSSNPANGANNNKPDANAVVTFGSNGEGLFTGNVGIGTTIPQNALSVTGGVAIGSLAYAGLTGPSNGLIVAGNVGLGSTNPGQALDVNGTVRTTAFTMSGQTPVSGYVLTASDSAGDTTWTSAGAVSGWTVSGNNVYETAGGNVGIGTTLLTTSALAVMNGNVGIGTWIPASALEVNGNINLSEGANRTIQVNGVFGNALTIQAGSSAGGGLANGGNLFLFAGSSASLNGGNTFVSGGTGSQSGSTILADTGTSALGNVGIGTITPKNEVDIKGNLAVGSAYAGISSGPLNGLIVQGNVGLGSLVPGQALDVAGTIRTTGFTMSGQTPVSGYVLTASDSAGDTTWESASAVGGWTVSGNSVYETSGGNVGIGTTTVNQGTALAVTNGNVGIGTWTTAGGSLIIMKGNVGIGSVYPGVSLDVQGTVRALYFIGNGSQLTNLPAGGAAGANTQVQYNSAGNLAGATNFAFNSATNSLGVGTSAPLAQLAVAGNGVGIGTNLNSTYLTTVPPIGGMIVQGNVGLGSLIPGQALDVTGTVRTTGFTMSGQTPVSGYVLTASDSAGDTTWTSAGAVSGWTVSGNNVYETNSGNIGIGTTTVNQGTALAITNGNVGIGTWTTAGGSLIIMKGNVGIGSVYPGVSLDVQGTVRALYFIGNGSQLTNLPAGGAAGSNTQVQYNSAGNLAGSTNFAFNSATNSLGIGTSAPVAQLAVAGNGVGIGTNLNSTYLTTAPPIGGMIVQGNVGLGSLVPGQALDVAGTIRTMGFTMSGQTPVSGYVLTASDSAGDTTWTSAGAVSGWTISGNNVYETAGGNVGIGTTTVNQGALVVTNGNVGIGTFAPTEPFDIKVAGFETFVTAFGGLQTNGTFLANATAVTKSNAITNQALTIEGASGQTAPIVKVLNGNNNAVLSVIDATGNLGIGTVTATNAITVVGNIGIGTGINSPYVTTAAPNGGMIVQGNVGVGSLTPGQALDVTGTVRTIAFTMSGQTPVSGYVLTASDSAGDTTWTSAGAVSGWTISGNNVYETAGGNVGIGTTLLTTSALTVMNGNVGIGTWIPLAQLQISGSGSSLVYGQFGNDLQLQSNTVANGAGNEISFRGINTAPINSGIYAAITAPILANGAAGSEGNLVFSTKSSNSQPLVGLSEAMRIINGGNVGIGSFGSNGIGSKLTVVGNIGIGTGFSSTYVSTSAPNGGMIVEGNVGIGSFLPGVALDVQGTSRMTGFTLTGNGAGTGFVMVTNSIGVGTWMPASTLPGTGTTPGGGQAAVQYNNSSSFAGNATKFAFDGTNVGIGTSGPLNSLDILGNIGIGTESYSKFLTTAAPNGGMIVEGNVGIGSVAPGQKLDILGTVRDIGEIVNGNVGIGTANLSYALSVLTPGQNAMVDLYGVAGGGNPDYGVLEVTSIGGSIPSGQERPLILQPAGVGNIGIGTTTPAYPLHIFESQFALQPNSAAFPVVFTQNNSSYFSISNGGAQRITLNPNGNVGIGSLTPGQILDVTGTVRTTAFTMSGQTPVSGYVLTASDSAGDTTWTSAGAVSGWTVSGNNVYETAGGNVGIGTTLLTTSALTVMNGNVGIGTWKPVVPVQIVGIGTLAPNGGGMVVTSGNVGIGTIAPQALLAVNGNTLLGSTGSTLDSIVSNGTGSMAGGAALDAGGNTGSIISSNIGSLAFGEAQGSGGGNGSITASNAGAIALGSAFDGSMISSGAGSIVMGRVNSGWTMQSSGTGSIAMGYGGNGTLQATGLGSVAIGEAVQSNTSNALTFGNNVINNIPSTFMVGFYPTPTMTVTSNNVGVGTFAPASVLTVNGGLGIGTTVTNSAYVGINSAPSGGLIVQGNVGIGTFNPFGGGLIVLPANTGNVGIGSLTPGQALDVQGTSRMTGFTLTGNGAGTGFVMVTNGVGVGTWMASNTLPIAGSATAGGSTPQLQYNNNGSLAGIGSGGSNGTNIGIGTVSFVNALDILGNIGIGTESYSKYLTTSAPNGGMIVEGNIGIGTITPSVKVHIVGGGGGATGFSSGDLMVLEQDSGGGDAARMYILGGSAGSAQLNFGSSSTNTAGYITYKMIPNSMTLGTNQNDRVTINGNGNVGIGSSAPGQILDVAGTVRTTAFTMSGQTPVSGYELTASDSAGDTTWTSAGAVSGWTVSGNNVYETAGGNVGIGTTLLTTSALTVMNGNVGIGTWKPGNSLEVKNGNIGVSQSFSLIGIGTTSTILTLQNDTSSVYLGWQAGASIPTGLTFDNTALGDLALNLNSGGTGQNTAVGYKALAVLTSGINDTALGALALQFDTTGNYNTAVGDGALLSNTTGLKNTAVGYLTLNNNNTGYYNTAIGYEAGYPGQTNGTVTGSFNVFLGANSGPSGTSDWNESVGIGSFAITGGNNVMVLGGMGANALNVGIGTYTPVNTLSVSGNAEIGSGTAYTGVTGPPNGLIVQGNVGLGSLTPGQALDVQGTSRMTGFTLTGNGAGVGNVMVSNGVGIGTWMASSTLPIAGSASAGGSTPQLQYNNNGSLAGIGSGGSNGTNIGIGTVSFVNVLDILGNIGIGTVSNSKFLTTAAPAGGMILEGNVGIGSLTPGQKLDIAGTIRTTAFTMSGQTPVSGYVLTASDSAGDTTWTSAGAVSGWTVSGNNVYETAGGNVGIGTTSLTQGALVVTNGNVGIGTWAPAGALTVMNGNVGIGTNNPTAQLVIEAGTPSGAVPFPSGLIVDSNSNTSVQINSGTSAAGEILFGSSSTLANNNQFQYNYLFGAYRIVAAGAEVTRIQNNGNVGILTMAPGSVLTVSGNAAIGSGSSYTSLAGLSNGLIVQGNVGIGTFKPFGGGLIILPASTGNVGIGSLTPGQALDVTGTVRTTAFTMSGQTPVSGYVLTASDSAGDTTWTSAGAVSGWTVSGNNVYETAGGNVGIGTTLLTTSALTVMNGNVGIGTWVPGGTLQVGGTTTPGILVGSNNQVSIGTNTTGYSLEVYGGDFFVNNSISSQGDIWSSNNGTIFGSGTNASSTVAVFGNLAVGAGYATLQPAPTNGMIVQGNVGIGTFYTNNQLSLNGAVGIGTANSAFVTSTAPSGGMIVQGNVGLGSLTPGQALDVQGTSRMTGFTLTGNGAGSGNVLVSNGVGIGTWMSPSSIGASGGAGTNYWTLDTGNIGINTTNNVGISTISQVNSLNILGNIGIGTASNSKFLATAAPKGGMIVEGNVGLGTYLPDSALSVKSPSENAVVDIYGISSSSLDYGAIQVSNGGILTNPSGRALWLQPNGGNVGIGTVGVTGNTSILTGNLDAGSTGAQGPSINLTGEVFNNGTSIAINGGETTNNGSAGNVNIEGMVGQNNVGGDVFLESGPSFNNVGGTLHIYAGSGGLRNGYVAIAAPSDNPGNVGIGTIAPTGALEIEGGSVGIGTWTTTGGQLIVSLRTGNVGIGSIHPGQALDVQGTSRMTGFTLTGNGAAVGNVMVTNGVGVGTWMPSSTLPIAGSASAGGSTPQLQYNNNGSLAGIGSGGTNGTNIGIGTISFANSLNVVGNVGISTLANSPYLTASLAGPTALAVEGNVGIGTWLGQRELTVQTSNAGTPSMVALYNNNTTDGAGAGISFRTDTTGAGAGQFNELSDIQVVYATHNNATIASHMGIYASSGGSENHVLAIYGTGLGILINPLSALDVNGSEAVGGYAGNDIAPTNGLAVEGNVGFGTWLPVNQLVVNGAVGIGTVNSAYVTTVAPAGGMIIQGNVGIGSLTPGQALDVQGTSRMTGFTLTGNGAASGNVLVSNGVGIGTWMSPSSIGASGGASSNYWLLNGGNNVGINTTQTVGIGTSFTGGTGEGALSVMNGNVGIGTWLPAQLLDVNGTLRALSYSQPGTTSSNLAFSMGDTAGVASISAPHIGAFAGGDSEQAGAFTASISATSYGDFAYGSISSTDGTASLTASGLGSVAFGSISNEGTITSSGSGSFADGYVPNVLTSIIASGNGSMAVGSPGGQNLQATGLDSIAMGFGVQANASTSFAFGSNVINNLSGAFMVGFNATPTLTVTGTGVGIGTLNPFGGGLIVLPANTGNVGIGSLTPGQALDVQGTSRMTGFTLTGNGAGSGNVMVSNGVGIGTWMPVSTLGAAAGTNYWLLNGGNNVGINTTQTVGIGTSFTGGTGEASLAVMNGNVGIGTWLPGGILQVGGTTTPGILVGSNNQVSIGTNTTGYSLEVYGGTFYVNSSNQGTIWSSNNGTIFGNSSNPDSTVAVSGNLAVGAGYANSQPAPLNGMIVQGNVGIGTATSNGSLNINGGVGIGTLLTNGAYFNVAAPSGGLIVQGNVGMGTFNPFGGGLIVLPANTGNVGIGSVTPGQALDVQGTSRMTGFTLTGNGASSGNVMVSNGVGIGTWMPVSTLGAAAGTNYWLLNGGNNVGINTTQTVGIGTSFTGGTGEASLSVMNGNVGIGTWLPASPLEIHGNTSSDLFDIYQGATKEVYVDQFNALHGQLIQGTNGQFYNSVGGSSPVLSVNGISAHSYIQSWGNNGTGLAYDAINGNGNLGLGTFNTLANTLVVNGAVGIGTANSAFVTSTAPSGGLLVQNNVGIGSLTPGQILDVQGTARMTGFTLNLNPNSGYVLVGNGVGVGTWMPASTIGAANGTNYWLLNAGNNVGINTTQAVGIGTSFTGGTAEAALSVMNGNVGIGTWIAAKPLSVIGDTYHNGNVGIGTFSTSQAALSVTNGNVGIGTWVPRGTMQLVGVGTATIGSGLMVTNANVGIGTTIPAGTLTVENATNIQNELVLNNGATGVPPAYVIGGTTYTPTLAVNENETNGSRPLWFGYNSNGTQSGTWASFLTVGACGAFTQMCLDMGSTTTPALDTGLVWNSGNIAIGGVNGVPGFSAADGNASNIYFGAAGNVVVPTGNVGIGTASVGGEALEVEGGNVGIGTWTTTGGQLIISTRLGNVGIGTIHPGQALDIQGTSRMTGFALTGNGANSGNVMVSNGIGVGTWMASTTLNVNATATPGGSNPQLQFNNNNVMSGVAGSGADLNGNIGLGTTGPHNKLDVLGNIGIGTEAYSLYLTTTGPNGGMAVEGNVGIGTWAPASGLQLNQSFAVYRVGTAASLNPTAGQTIIGVTSTAAARTITLATADTVIGRVIIIKDESGAAATHNITVNCQGAQTIDGVASVTITANYGVVRLYSDGNNWFTF